MKRLILTLIIIIISTVTYSQYFSFQGSCYITSSGNFISYSGSMYMSTGGSSIHNVNGITINNWELTTLMKDTTIEINDEILNYESYVNYYRNKHNPSKYPIIINNDIDINVSDIKLNSNKDTIIKNIGKKSNVFIKTDVSFTKEINKFNEKRISKISDEQSLNVLGVLPNVEIYEFIDYKPSKNDFVLDGHLIFYNDSLIYCNFTIFHNEPEFKIVKLFQEKFNIPMIRSEQNFINYRYFSKNRLYICYDTDVHSFYEKSNKYKFQAISTIMQRKKISNLIFDFYSKINKLNKKSAQNIYDEF